MNQDSDIITKMDPFVVVELNGQRFSTSIKENEGTHCIWKETAKFKVNSLTRDGRKLIIRVYDEDVTNNELAGEGTVDLLKEGLLVPSSKPVTKEYNLAAKGVSAGTIKIESDFVLASYNRPG